MSSVFMSYSREDGAFASILSDELEKRGLSVFRDSAISGGEDFSHQIREALQFADVVVVLLSSNSQRSRWIKDEVATALESRKKVIPVLLDAGAKENWVWPLLADRQARTAHSATDVPELATEIEQSIEARMILSAPEADLAPGGTGRWLLIAVAIGAALLGAILTLLFAN
jgi:hypothetical protein